MSVTIRTASPDSAQLRLRIGGRAAGPDEWDQWSEEPGHDLVALIDGRVVGGVHVSLVSRSEAWLENLRVLPDAQGRGIAAQLVKEAEAVARRYGAAMARTAIPAHEYAAQAVAERGGYKPSLRCVVVEAPLPSGPTHIPYDAQVAAVQAAAVFAVRQDAAVVSVIDGTPPGMQAVFGAVVEAARAREATRTALLAPDLRSLEVLGVRSWAPHPWCPEGLVVVEKSLAS